MGLSIDSELTCGNCTQIRFYPNSMHYSVKDIPSCDKQQSYINKTLTANNINSQY